MITGSYDAFLGAIIHASVYFPSPVDRFLQETAFVVDSGAATSSLMRSDVFRLGDDLPNLTLRHEASPLWGIGGTLDRFSTEATIEFTDDSGQTAAVRLRLSVILDDSARHLPSLIGRDVLMLAKVTLNPESETVTFDLPAGFHDLLG